MTIGRLVDAVILAGMAAWAFSHMMPWWVPVGVIIAIPLMKIGYEKRAARHVAERQKNLRLIRHADGEHRLVQEGKMAGVYGSYEPPPAIRGMGIWIVKK